MSITPPLSDAKRALLEQYRRGEIPQRKTRPRGITPRPAGTPAPLSFGQRQLWLAAQRAPGMPIDTEFMTLSINGGLNVAALRRAFDEMIRRHEIMRTTIALVNGQPLQVIHAPDPFDLPVVDLRALPACERAAEAARQATHDARMAFDLARGPLLRAKVMRLEDAESRIFLTLHHSVFDCVSAYTVFLRELTTLYTAFDAGQRPHLPELAVQYADYALWQREQVHTPAAEDDRAYWREQLRGSAALELPTDHPRPPTPTFRGAVEAATFPQELTEALEAVGRRQGATLFMLLVAAFQTVLHRYSGHADVVVGTETGSRGPSEFEPLVGFFLNTLVLRGDFSGNPTIAEVLRRVRRMTLDAYAHGKLPFEHVVADLAPGRDADEQPLFQAMIRLGPRLAPLDVPWTVSQVDIDPEVSKFDLTLDVYDTPSGLVCRLEYSTDLFDRSRMACLLADLRRVLESIAVDQAQHLSELAPGGGRVTRHGDPPPVAAAPQPSRKQPSLARWMSLEKQLVAIWEELLGAAPLGRSDNFFELGGTSLLALRMLTRIEDVLGQAIPLSALFEEPTIEHLASVIMEGVDPRLRSPLVQVQRGANNKPAFFFVHGEPDGAGFYTRGLAQYLDPDQPFYILQSSGPDGGVPPPSVERISATLVQALRSFQPRGPYRLGGWCNGGTIAYEMARQLEAQGQRVDLLVLLHSRTQYDARLRFGYAVIAHCGKLIGLNLEQQVLPYLLYRAARAWADDLVRLARAEPVRLLRVLGGQVRLGPGRRRTTRSLRAQAGSLIEACRQKDRSAPVFWACSGYVPGPYAGKVTLCWWTDEPGDRKDPTMGWGTVAREVEVRPILGSQDGIVWGRPYLRAFAQQLQACLATLPT